MLFYLHVKNLALIDSAEVEFTDGLNILTGETGAGKSIVLGSVSLALGAKASRDLIRQGCDSAWVELCFAVDENKRRELEAREIYPDEDGLVIISRKILPSRTISRINDETVTSARLREITGLLIEMHGQHENQSLMSHLRHLDILDEYGKAVLGPMRQEVAAAYRKYAELRKKLDTFQADGESRLREMDFCRYEIGEIESAALREGEEEELSALYRRFSNGKKLGENMAQAYEAVSQDAVSHALRAVDAVLQYDREGLSQIRDEMGDAEALLGELARDISSYLEQLTFDEEEFRRVEERLDQVRTLEGKYGRTIGDVLRYLEEKKVRLRELENYDARREETQAELKEAERNLELLSSALFEARRREAESLTEKIKEGLLDLNFPDVKFTMEFRRLDHFTPNGFDEAEFMISANPGEPLRPLSQVASGGELSRVMLAVKTVLAEADQVPTLIFDEIDAGISGRTAQMVSEKLGVIAKCRQVICITHLPQIAAMADRHFVIRKGAESGRTITTIRALKEDEMTEELARLLGGAEITDTVRKNAREMKQLAKKRKQKLTEKRDQN